MLWPDRSFVIRPRSNHGNKNADCGDLAKQNFCRAKHCQVVAVNFFPKHVQKRRRRRQFGKPRPGRQFFLPWVAGPTRYMGKENLSWSFQQINDPSRIFAYDTLEYDRALSTPFARKLSQHTQKHALIYVSYRIIAAYNKAWLPLHKKDFFTLFLGNSRG